MWPFDFNSISSNEAEAMAIMADKMVPILVNCQSVNRIPIPGSIEAWNIIAPVMFPKAKVSFSLEIQITLLNFSGSSVAIGVRIMANTKAGI